MSRRAAPKANSGVRSVVPVRFAVFDAKQHDHVPMLCTPWRCPTCRGS
jgi:5-hydroxyisourate hydrolase